MGTCSGLDVQGILCPRKYLISYLQAWQMTQPTMAKTSIYKILTYCIATVWIANGLFCKVLNLVPRHEQIVARILGNDYSKLFTVLIGISEIIMAVWILSAYKSKLNAITQIALVATMNTLEFILAPDLLLWGKLNSLFACIFILVIYFNEFQLNKKQLK